MGCCADNLHSLKELKLEEVKCFEDCVSTMLFLPKIDLKLEIQNNRAQAYMKRFSWFILNIK